MRDQSDARRERELYDVPDIQSIRTLHQRGYSERQIAKLLKLNRATVHRYIEMAVVPTQVRMEIQEPRPAVKFKDEWKKTVRDLLQAEAEKQVRRKQRLTARKVHEVLVAKHSADISEVTVRRYVAEIRAERAKKAFVPLEFAPGEMAEVDFGHAEIIIGGVRKLWPFFAIRLMASGVRFVMVFADEKLESLLAGIVHGLSFIGGVPHRLMFDNPSTAASACRALSSRRCARTTASVRTSPTRVPATRRGPSSLR